VEAVNQFQKIAQRVIQNSQKQSLTTDNKEDYKYHLKCLKKELVTGIPNRFDHKNFDSYKLDKSGLEEKVTGIKEYSKNYKDHLDNGQAVYLFGKVGNGKTHLAIALAKDIVARAAKKRTDKAKANNKLRAKGFFTNRRPKNLVRFIEGPSFFQSIRDSFDNDSQDNQSDLMDRVKKVPVLVWDDILAEKPSEWLLEQMHIIINYRYLNELPTIFTSNLPIEHFNKLSQNQNYFMGKRIFSRMAEMCKGYIFKFDYEDTRLKVR
jgi:DNA replication protein DnaC